MADIRSEQIHAYFKTRLMVRLSYPLDLLLHSFGNLLVAAIGVVFLWAVYRHVPHIDGWRFHEVLVIWGMAECCSGLLFVFFQGLWSLNQHYLLGGQMDRVLTRPMHPLLQVLLDNINPGDLAVMTMGIGMVAFGAHQADGLIWWHWLLLPLFLGSGTLILAGVLLGVSSAGFRVHHRGTAVGLVYQASVFNRYPLTLFPRSIQWALTIVPFAFASYYPAAFLLGRADPTVAVLQPLVGPLVFIIGLHIWTKGLANYRSTGS